MARASLDELLLDYEDYLRQRRLPLWPKDSPDANEVRTLGRKIGAQGSRPDPSDQSNPTDPSDAGARARQALYAPWLEHEDATVVANTLLCLIHQANYLLDQQLIALEHAFIEEGGFSEQLAAARIAHRSGQTQVVGPNHTDRDFPCCPLCGKLMSLRTARQGKNSGTQFWGCTGYPDCTGARPLNVP